MPFVLMEKCRKVFKIKFKERQFELKFWKYENYLNLPSSEQFLNMIMAEFEHVPQRKIVAKCWVYNFCFGRFQSLVVEFGESRAANFYFRGGKHRSSKFKMLQYFASLSSSSKHPGEFVGEFNAPTRRPQPEPAARDSRSWPRDGGKGFE